MMLIKVLFLFCINYFVIRTFFLRRRPDFLKLTRIFSNYDPLQEQLDFVEQLLLTMKTGKSYESAALEVVQSDDLWKKWHRQSENPNQEELICILGHCRKHSSQSYSLLTSFRKTLRQRLRLHEKQKLMTLQAKAQALVSSLIFVALTLSQWLINPDFRGFLSSAGGRLIFSLCFSLVFAGVVIVFNMSRPQEVVL
jgi:hypothetical protein